MQVAQDKVVVIDYTLKDDAGEVLDTSTGDQPLYYLHGAGNIIAGLENALTGKVTGDTVQITIAPQDAYGEHDDQLQRQVPRSDFEDAENLQVGMRFRASTEGGETIVTVIEFDDETVTLDGNHPLAGETLHFDVIVREVRDASQEELDHGHVHGPGGHHH